MSEKIKLHYLLGDVHWGGHDVHRVAEFLIGLLEKTDAFEITCICDEPRLSDITFDDYFADTVTNVGLKGEQAETQLLSQATIMEDLLNLRDSISGVNIDEELAEIMKFQHGYNAAARFITVWDSMLDTIINRLGV